MGEGLFEFGEHSPLVLEESHLHSPGPQSVLTSVIRATGDDNAVRTGAQCVCPRGDCLGRRSWLCVSACRGASGPYAGRGPWMGAIMIVGCVGSR